jgi:hypothetical protein
MATIEQRFSAQPRRTVRLSELLEEAEGAIARTRRLRTRQFNLERLKVSRRRDPLLADTLARMHGDDLDRAWKLLMRGDDDLAWECMADHVPSHASHEVRVASTGSPWRKWQPKARH